MDDRSGLVVGVDASEESLAALEWALRVADDLGHRVVAVHAVGLLEGQHLRPRPDVADAVADVRARNQRYADVDVDTVYEDGAPADVIVRIAERERAELIVVGSRGLGQAPRLIGSTSEGVLAHSAVPVLVVPAGSFPTS